MSAYRYRDPARVNATEAWRSTLIRDIDERDLEFEQEWAAYEDANAKCNVAYAEQDWRLPKNKGHFDKSSRALQFLPQAEAIVTEWIRLGRPDPPPWGNQSW